MLAPGESANFLSVPPQHSPQSYPKISLWSIWSQAQIHFPAFHWGHFTPITKWGRSRTPSGGVDQREKGWGLPGLLTGSCLGRPVLELPICQKESRTLQSSQAPEGGNLAGEHNAITQNTKYEVQHQHYVLRAMWRNLSTSRSRA